MTEEIGHILQNRVDLVIDKIVDHVQPPLGDTLAEELRSIRDDIPCSCDDDKLVAAYSDNPSLLRAKARELVREAEYYVTYEPDNEDDATRLYALAEKFEVKAAELDKPQPRYPFGGADAPPAGISGTRHGVTVHNGIVTDLETKATVPCIDCGGRNVQPLNDSEWECHDCGITYLGV